MKSFFFTLSFVLFGVNCGMATSYPIKQLVKYERLQTQTIALPTHFAKPFIIDQKDIDLLVGKTIHHIELIYTKYAESPDFNQKALNDDRIAQLKKLLPQINANQPTWAGIEQTGATTRDVANDYFHGFVIHYGDKLDHNELGKFLSEFSTKPNQFDVNYPDGGTFSLPSGTKIKIDPKAVTYLDGKPVSGYYTLFYTEYKNPAEIALSGLPMAYDDANFSSIGMYELRAEKDGKELKLIQPMTVDFNCTKVVDDAAFFAMDDKTGEWKKQHDLEFEMNPKNVNVNGVDAPVALFVMFGKESQNVNIWLLQIDDKTTKATLDEGAWLNYKQLKKNEQPVGIISCDSVTRTFEIETPHIAAFQNAIFGAKDLVKGAPKLKGAHGGKRTAIPNDRRAMMLAEGSSDPGHTYPTIVKGLSSSNFGVYNCDQVYRIGESATINPIYKDSETGEYINDGHVTCVMDLSYNGSFSFHPNYLTLNKNGRNAILLFTKDKEIYLLDEKAFAQLDLEAGQTVAFPMQNVTDKLKSPGDLKTMLNI